MGVQKTSEAVDILFSRRGQDGVAHLANLIKPFGIVYGDRHEIAANGRNGAVDDFRSHRQGLGAQNRFAEQQQEVAKMAATNINQLVSQGAF